MAKSIIRLVLSILLVSSPLYVHAEVFPTHHNDVDVVYTDNTYADLAAKVWMIDQARQSISISAFLLGKDQYGLTIAAALRRALDRGVDVRVMYEGSVARVLGNDLRLRITDLLVDPRLKKKARVLNLGLLEKKRSHLALNDYLHEKIVMVDPLTENEMIYFGGRDLSEFSRITIDSGYVIRPIIGAKGRPTYYVGDDIRSYYNSLWVILSQYFVLESTTLRDAQKAVSILHALEPIENSYSDADREEVQKVLSVLESQPREGDTLASFQFRPETTQIITNDFIRNVTVDNYAKSLGVRPEMYDKDDILKFIVSMVQKSSRIEIVSYSSHFVPQLHEAFKELCQRGRLLVYTNGYEAMASMDPLGVSAISFDYTMMAMRALEGDLSRKQLQNGALQILGLNRDSALKQTRGLQSYLHRKLMIFDDQYVLTGSYNFTESSSSKNDEFVVLFKDSRMTEHHIRLNRAEKERVYETLKLTDEGYLVRLKNSIKRLMLGEFVKSQY